MALVLVVAMALLGAWASAGGASATAPAVSLVLPAGQALHAGESVPVSVLNDSASPIYRSDCFVLARLDAGGWRSVLDSQGVNVACAIWAGKVQSPQSRQPEGLPLYHDLHPGTYRITLYYRPTPRRWKVLIGADPPRPVRALEFTIGPAPAQPKPQLSEKRILRIAMAAAKHAQDPHPRLIQHAAGTHFKAVLIGQGDRRGPPQLHRPGAASRCSDLQRRCQPRPMFA